MNKNTLLALILSIGILMIWSYFFGKKAKQIKTDMNPPVFQGINDISVDYKNNTIQLNWDPAEDESQISYLIYFNTLLPVQQGFSLCL